MDITQCVVTGAAGRMGTRIINTIYHTEGVRLAGATERMGHPRMGADVGELLGRGKTTVTIADSLDAVVSNCDVVIDFTSPESSLTTLQWAHQARKAVVIGTTGFSLQQTDCIKTLARDIPCVFSPNMSIGINIMLTIIGQAARILRDQYDMEIIEAHHRFKKDAPSGTAIKMAQVLAEAVNRDLEAVAVHQRKGTTGERSREEIGIQVIRAGDIVGEHTVLFGGLGERLEITHRAHNRDTFARGAVRAAQWIVSQPPGLYDMLDVLDLK